MLATPIHPSNRRNQSAEPYEAAKLTGQACAELSRLGVSTSPSKVSRLVHRWLSRVRFTGYGFAEWIADGLALDAERRARVTREMRAISYADPTGETAVNNVQKGRGY